MVKGVLSVNRIGEEPLAWDSMLAMSVVLMVAAAVYGGLDAFWRETDCQLFDLNVSSGAVNRCCSAAIRKLPFFATLALVNAVTFVAILVYTRVKGQVLQLRQAIDSETQLLHSMNKHLLLKKLDLKLTGKDKDEDEEAVDATFTFFHTAPASQRNYVKFHVQTTYRPELAKRLNIAVAAAFVLSVVATGIFVSGTELPLVTALGWGMEQETFQCGLAQCFTASHIRVLVADAPVFSSLAENNLLCHRGPESVMPAVLMAIGFVLAFVATRIFGAYCRIINMSQE